MAARILRQQWRRRASRGSPALARLLRLLGGGRAHSASKVSAWHQAGEARIRTVAPRGMRFREAPVHLAPRARSMRAVAYRRRSFASGARLITFLYDVRKPRRGDPAFGPGRRVGRPRRVSHAGESPGV